MTWIKPNCQTCKKPIAKASESVAFIGVMPYHHCKCLLEETKKTAGIGVAVPAMALSGVGVLATMNVIEELKSINPEKPDARDRFQKYLMKSFTGSLVITVVLDLFALAIIYAAFVNFSTLLSNIMVLIAGILMILVAGYMTYGNGKFLFDYQNLNKEIEFENPKK